MTELRSKPKGIFAALITIALVGGLEFLSILRPSGPLVQAAYFFIPAIVAVLIYRTWVARIVAFIVLTILGFLSALVLMTLLV